MEFRAPSTAAKLNAEAIKYFTKNLSDPETGRRVLEDVISELGSAVDNFPYWHPILTAPIKEGADKVHDISMLKIYDARDHTREFVRGFITCPYSESAADELMNAVNQVDGLNAYRLQHPLYADNAYPVVVEASEVELEVDGTIRSLDTIKWFAKKAIDDVDSAEIAETWWNIRSSILGRPHGSRSSLFVNQYAGGHMRKILEALNNSGIYGEIKEWSLGMLSKKKRDRICETVLRAALKKWDKEDNMFHFELRGELCNATIRDTWDDGYELSIRVKIRKEDLYVTGYYYKKDDRLSYTDPIGRRVIAEKFI